MIYGYSQLRGSVDNTVLYTTPLWLRPVTLLLMIFAMVMLVVSSFPGKLKTMVVHPQIAAVKIWAFAHLLSNGDLASVLLFGSFLVWAVASRIGYKKRGEIKVANPVNAWSRNDAIAIALGVIVYIVFAFWLHPLLIKVSVAG